MLPGSSGLGKMLPVRKEANLPSGPAGQGEDLLAGSDVPGPPWFPVSHTPCSACCVDNLECLIPGLAGLSLALLDAWSHWGDSCGPDYNLWSQNMEQSCCGSQCFPEECSQQNFFHSESCQRGPSWWPSSWSPSWLWVNKAQHRQVRLLHSPSGKLFTWPRALQGLPLICFCLTIVTKAWKTAPIKWNNLLTGGKLK